MTYIQAQERDTGEEEESFYREPGTQLTGFTGTKVQILTQGTQFICVTSTKVQNLTQKEMSAKGR